MNTKLVILGLLALVACTKEPTPKQAEQVPEPAVAADETAALKAKQKSIEDAADAAAKLVEEESREEIEQLKAESEEQK